VVHRAHGPIPSGHVQLLAESDWPPSKGLTCLNLLGQVALLRSGRVVCASKLRSQRRCLRGGGGRQPMPILNPKFLR
jgi:hypothetical protein